VSTAKSLASKRCGWKLADHVCRPRSEYTKYPANCSVTLVHANLIVQTAKLPPSRDRKDDWCFILIIIYIIEKNTLYLSNWLQSNVKIKGNIQIYRLSW
jgi:hypothetical protein